MCEKCGHQLAETCGEETCGFCFGKALEAGTLPKIKAGRLTIEVTFNGHTFEVTTKGGPNG